MLEKKDYKSNEFLKNGKTYGMENEIKFEGGINIAIKLPKSKYEQTVAFYRDILKLDVQENPINDPTVSKTHQVKSGNNILWLDCVDNYTHSETWLELNTADVPNATKYLSQKKC